MAIRFTAVPREDLDDISERFAIEVIEALSDTLAEGFGDSPDAMTAAGWRELFRRGGSVPTPADTASLRTLWGRRVSALTERIKRVYGKTVLSVRDRITPAVGPPPEDVTEVDWQERVSAVTPVVPPEAADPVLEDASRDLTELGDDLFDAVADEIQEGTREDESLDAITVRVQRAVDDAGWRARRVARTEMNRAVNTAALAEMAHLGLSGTKRWVAHDDHRTRPTHHEADGQTVAIPEMFTVGGSPMSHPGDPTAPAREVVNCRCEMAFDVPEDQNPDWAPDPDDDTDSAEQDTPDTLEKWMTDTVPDNPVEELTAAADEEFQSGMPLKLKKYWLTGEGAAKIRWGTPGSFERCVKALRPKFPADPEGLCANLHHEATGHWPGERKDKSSLTAAADASTGAMVALVPSAADAARLAVADGEPMDQLHVTLLYLGKAADFSSDTPDRIVERLEEHAFTGPVVADAFSVGVFNPGDVNDRDPCVVLGLSGSGLSEVHDWVNQVLVGDMELPHPDQHRPWVPHVTLAYTDDVSRVGNFTDRVGPVTFDRILVAFAGDYRYIPLGSPVPEVAAEVLPTGPEGEPLSWPEGSFEAVITAEGLETGDSRAFLPGALTVAPGPWLEFNWQPAMEDGHEKAVLVGRLEDVWRVDDGTIMARGRFDVEGIHAREAMRMVRGGFLKGVSVDVDTAVAEQFFDNPESDEPTFTLYHSARIRGATLVTYPAYVETWIRMIEGEPMSAVDPEHSLVASGEPVAVTACACDSTYEAPPDDAFQNPGFTRATPPTVTADGRFFGHSALWGTCHTSVQGTCRTPPREGEHAYFRLFEVVTASGASVPVGHVTMGIGHAPTRDFSAAAAMEHYDNTDAVVADVASGEDAFGIWFSGMIRSSVPEERRAHLRSAQLSGDWRSFGGRLRLVAMLAVNVPGFPVPRLSTMTADGRQSALVAAGMVGAVIVDAGARSVVMSSLRRRMGRDVASRRELLRTRVHGEG